MHVMLTRLVTAAQRGAAVGALLACAPLLAQAQSSPFMTGATALQTNILAWLTPIAVILVMVLGAMAMANRIAQVSSTYGSGEAQTIVENCGNTLILRCSGSEHGGTSQFASRLIGEREVVRVTRSRSRRALEVLPAITHSEHRGVEAVDMGAEIQQLPDLAGYLKLASSPAWLRVGLQPAAAARGALADQHSTSRAAGLVRANDHPHEGCEPDPW